MTTFKIISKIDKKVLLMQLNKIISVIVLFLMVHCNGEITMNDLVLKNSLYYRSGESVPFTGKAITYFSDSGIMGVVGKAIQTETTIVGGNLDGLYIEYYENGQRKIDYIYRMNKKEGEYREYYENGQIMIYGKYLSDKLEGEVNYFQLSGKLSKQENYKNGLLEGLVTEYDELGLKTTETTYKAGNKSGRYTLFHKNGQIKEEGHFINNKLTGVYTYYNDRGKLLMQNRY